MSHWSHTKGGSIQDILGPETSGEPWRAPVMIYNKLKTHHFVIKTGREWT